VTLDADVLKIFQIAAQMIATIVAAIFAFKRWVSNPLQEEMQQLRQTIKAENRELQKWFERELRYMKEEHEQFKNELGQLKVEVKSVQKEYTPKELHWKDVSGWRGEVRELHLKIDGYQRWLTEQLFKLVGGDRCTARKD